MVIPQESELDGPKKRGILYIRKHYPEFCQYILDTYPHINKFNAGIYLYYKHMDHPLCPMCGKPTPFLDQTRGFQKFCSYKCANKDPEVATKRKKTNLRKFGTEHAAQNESIKQKLIQTTTERYGGMGNAAESTKEKQKKTMQERYGVEYGLQNPDLLSKAMDTSIRLHGGIGSGSEEIKSKIKQTQQERYGGEVLANQEIREKIKKTCLERYGTENPASCQEIRDKNSATHLKTFSQYHPDIIGGWTENNELYYKVSCPHPECTQCSEKYYIIPAPRYCNRRLDGTEPCTKLVPILRGRNKNTTIEVFVKSILDEINRTPYLIFHDRKIIAPKEIDIVDPIAGFAFECNGCYWHSFKTPKYHFQKFSQCAEAGIQLFTIWEDWVKHKPEILRSIIKSKYHYFERSIYARKCQIKELNKDRAKVFTDENHLQGHARASVYYGLYCDDELVSLMSFSQPRACMGNTNSRGGWELVRFCNKLNTQVIGGANKLLQHFIKAHNPDKIISYSSNDISNGDLYKRLGFQKAGDNVSYWYIGPNYTRYHRSTFTKNAIIKKGLAPDKDNWTEFEAMSLHGFIRIYDSGQQKWVLEIKREP